MRVSSQTWKSLTQQPSWTKQEEASREKEPIKFPTGTCAWIWWAPTALSHHVLHILCNPLGTLQIISPTSKACYRVELLLSTILSMFVTNMDLSWNFALFTFKAIQGRKIEMETPKRDISIYQFLCFSSLLNVVSIHWNQFPDMFLHY